MSNSKIVYSARCSNTPKSYSPIGSTLVKVSTVTIVPRPMGAEEVRDAADKLNQSVDLLQALLNIGTTALAFLKDEKTAEKWTKSLGFISGVGDILKGILMFIPGTPNPMIEKLENLGKTVEELEKKISANFEEMKVYISEVNFFLKIISPTLLLTRSMTNCVKNPGPRTKRNFERVYNRHSPLQLVYTLKSYLEQDSTNPLKMAVEVEKPKKLATFNMWEDIICRILGQFLVLESFGSGLLGITHRFSWDRLYAAANTIVDSIAKWKIEYSRDENLVWQCWKEMNEWMSGYVARTTHLWNSERADEIKKKLETYWTSDAFYVIVFASGPWNEWYSSHCPNNTSQLIGDYDDKNCVYIYRSRRFTYSGPNEIEDITKGVQGCRQGKLQKNGNLEEIIIKQLIDGKLVRSDGFIYLIDKESSSHIRSVNCPGYEWGPGWWETVGIDNKDYTLLVALP